MGVKRRCVIWAWSVSGCISRGIATFKLWTLECLLSIVSFSFLELNVGTTAQASCLWMTRVSYFLSFKSGGVEAFYSCFTTALCMNKWTPLWSSVRVRNSPFIPICHVFSLCFFVSFLLRFSWNKNIWQLIIFNTTRYNTKLYGFGLSVNAFHIRICIIYLNRYVKTARDVDIFFRTRF